MDKVIRVNMYFARRCICTSKVNSKYSARDGRMMGKLMRKGNHNSSKWYNSGSARDSGLNKEKYSPSLGVQRRMTVLNKLFMGHITDIMSTGEVFPALQNRGLEITDIKVTASFSYLHVYWVDKALGHEYSLETQLLLNKYAPVLRHKLIQLGVMSLVPSIQFVKDKAHSRAKEVEYLLSIADYGPDYKPASRGIFEQRKENESLSSVYIPEMKHNVFGINHDRIMSKIKASLKSVKHDAMSNGPTYLSVNTMSNVSNSSDVTVPIDQKEQKALFTEYLRQRVINDRKKRENKKKAEVDAELYAADDDNDYEHNYYDLDELHDDNDDRYEDDDDPYGHDYKEISNKDYTDPKSES